MKIPNGSTHMLILTDKRLSAKTVQKHHDKVSTEGKLSPPQGLPYYHYMTYIIIM